MKKQLWKRLSSIALALVLVLGMMPMISMTAHAAPSNTVTIEGLTYTVSVKSATDRKGNNAMSAIEAVNFYGDETRNGNTVKITKIELTGYIGDATITFTDSNCAERLSEERTVQSGNDYVGYTTAVLSITRSPASHTGGTCTSPACTLCGETYDAPHDYKWKNNGTSHWQECTRDAFHQTSHGTCSGGTATCHTLATCATCKQSYGSLNSSNHEWQDWKKLNNILVDKHYRKCTYHDVYEYEECTPQPNCTQGFQCTVCKEFSSANENHSWGAWQTNRNGTHTRTCTLNSSHKETQACSGDPRATCTTAGTCTTCGGSYNTDSHSYTYAASGSTITETCENGCGHSATAKLTASNATYTGSAVKTASVAYSDGWAGGPLNPSYANNLNAGTATAQITKSGETATTTFTINAANISGAAVTLSPENGTYNGSESKPSVSVTFASSGNLVEGTDYTVSWDKNGFTYPDDYLLTVTGIGNFTGTKTDIFRIEPAALTDVSVEQTNELTYDGTSKTAEVTTSATTVDDSEVTFAYCAIENGTYGDMPGLSEAGEHTVYYKASAPNHEDSKGSFTVKINQAKASIEIPANQTATYDSSGVTAGTENADILYAYSGDGTVVVTWYDEDGNAINETPTNVGTYMIGVSTLGDKNYAAVSEVMQSFTIEKAEVAAPELASKVYNDEVQTADVTDTDVYKVTSNAGGTDAGIYEVVLHLKDSDNYKWADSDSAEKTVEFKITKKPLTVTAKAQTIKYGEEISYEELTVEGLLDGHIAQVALSADTTRITVSGKITANAVVLSGNADVTDNYDITYEDGTLRVTPDTSALDGLTKDNVTSDDIIAVKNLKDIMEEADFDGADEAAAKEWQEIIDSCDELIGAVDDAHAAVDTEAVGDAQEITEDNVQVADKETLEESKADLEQALKDYESNYTDEEKEILEAEIERIDALLDSIERVEQVEAEIAALPATVSPDDLTTVAKIEAAKKSYDALSDNEKAMVSDQSEKKLTDLVKGAFDYKIIKGNGSKWTVGSKNSLSFTANGAYSKFASLEVDGKVVNAKYYDVASGSTIITLKSSFLSGLKEGKHTIAVVYDDGEASGTFTVTTNPATGDDSMVGMWAGVFGVSAAALAIVLVMLLRKRREN